MPAAARGAARSGVDADRRRAAQAGRRGAGEQHQRGAPDARGRLAGRRARPARRHAAALGRRSTATPRWRACCWQHGAPLDVKDGEHDGTPLGWAIHGAEHGWHRKTGDYPRNHRGPARGRPALPDLDPPWPEPGAGFIRPFCPGMRQNGPKQEGGSVRSILTVAALAVVLAGGGLAAQDQVYKIGEGVKAPAARSKK